MESIWKIFSIYSIWYDIYKMPENIFYIRITQLVYINIWNILYYIFIISCALQWNNYIPIFLIIIENNVR